MSIIPTLQDFKCAVSPEDGLTVSVISSEYVKFITDNHEIIMTDVQQVTLLRDMLTVWLSRPTSKDNQL